MVCRCPTPSSTIESADRAGVSYFRGQVSVARGANSLPTEGREEVRAAGAGAQRGSQASGRARIRASRSPVRRRRRLPRKRRRRSIAARSGGRGLRGERDVEVRVPGVRLALVELRVDLHLSDESAAGLQVSRELLDLQIAGLTGVE